jgi:Tfp pilus assembly pilus retraction ATPase PilT
MKIADLLNLSVERGASDLHLTAGLPPLVRIDGEICPLFDEPVVGLAGSGERIDQQKVLALLHEVMLSAASSKTGSKQIFLMSSEVSLASASMPFTRTAARPLFFVPFLQKS